MRRIAPYAPGVVLAALLFGAHVLGAHDFFLRATSWDVPANAVASLHAYNGTFSRSENAVDGSRLVSLVRAHDGIVRPISAAAWTPAADSTARVEVETGAPGTLVVGAATAPRVLALPATEFNQYLADDGLPDELAARRRDGTADRPSRESYAKAVKAILRVGGRSGRGHDVVLGHDAELVPLDDPYAIRRGGLLRVKALGHGAPLRGQLVIAGGRLSSGARIPMQRTRTDRDGVARIRLTHGGSWYVKFIHMRRAPAGDSLTHVSRWASLTFGVP